MQREEQRRESIAIPRFAQILRPRVSDDAHNLTRLATAIVIDGCDVKSELTALVEKIAVRMPD